jgi:hypothetical protein
MQDDDEGLLKYIRKQDTWKDLAQRQNRRYLFPTAVIVHIIVLAIFFFVSVESLNLTLENIKTIIIVTLQAVGIIMAVIVALSFTTLRALSDRELDFRKLVYDYSLKLSEMQERRDMSPEFKRKISERVRKMFTEEEFYYKNPTWNKVHLGNTFKISLIDLGIALLLDFASLVVTNFTLQATLLKFTWGFLILGSAQYLIILLYVRDQF